MKLIEEGDIDPSFVITHRATLQDGPKLYKTFRDKKGLDASKLSCIPERQTYLKQPN
jgi:threonine dehydrogenase-like Zn-dependent dehydrogenase